MSGDASFSDLCLCDAFLIAAHGGDDAESPRVDFRSTVTDDANYEFLPSVFTPCFAPVTFTKVGDVFDDAVH